MYMSYIKINKKKKVKSGVADPHLLFIGVGGGRKESGINDCPE